MQQLSWQQFDDAVARLAERFASESIHGVYGIPRGGLCLAVALSHAMEQPFLLAPQAGCLVVDEVYETGQTLAGVRQQCPDAVFAVWVSKQPPEWWEAVEVTTSDEWIIFPWSNAARAAIDEQEYRASRTTS
mgnify:CR=1 FL=1|jgi:hypoxanthine phosphoribosyltransferase